MMVANWNEIELRKASASYYITFDDVNITQTYKDQDGIINRALWIELNLQINWYE